jgi:hypothetical protein
MARLRGSSSVVKRFPGILREWAWAPELEYYTTIILALMCTITDPSSRVERALRIIGLPCSSPRHTR